MNFENIAKLVNLDPLQVLSVYYQKHNSSINNYFKDGKEYSEPIEGRIKDMINYLLLMVAMLHKYKKGEEHRTQLVVVNFFKDVLNIGSGYDGKCKLIK